MKRTDLPKRFQELLDHCCYATVATVCRDGQAWSTPLYVAFDDSLNMYWASWPENQHSKNIHSEPRIFTTIFETNAEEGAGAGLYMKMKAHVIDDSCVASARLIYTTLFGEDKSHKPFIRDCQRRLYPAVPEAIWYNDGGNMSGQFIDIRKKLF